MWYGKFNFVICSVCHVSLIIESEKVSVTETTFNLSLIKYQWKTMKNYVKGSKKC